MKENEGVSGLKYAQRVPWSREKIHENGKYEFTDVIVKFEADRLSCEIKGQTH